MSSFHDSLSSFALKILRACSSWCRSFLLGGSIVSFTARALRKCIICWLGLEYRLHRFVISAAGAKVMNWFSVPGRFFYAKRERSRMALYQFVTGKISIAFFKLSYLFFELTIFSQGRGLALGGLKGLLLHGEHMTPDLRELNRKFIGSRRDLRFIERCYCRLVGVETLRKR